MSGCDNCAGKSDCTHRKGAMFEVLGEALATLYPTRTWGEPDDEARFGAGVDEDEAANLAELLADALSASSFHRSGEPEEYCEYIYILCVGREPCLIQLRDGGVPWPAELHPGPAREPVREQYLRVCLSHMARMAAVQQVAVELLPGAAAPGSPVDEYVVTERPRAGVYDAPLLHRFRRLVSLLNERDLTHLDFGEIAAPPEGFGPGVYPSLYGGAPDTANYLFYPQPATTEVTCVLAPGAAR